VKRAPRLTRRQRRGLVRPTPRHSLDDRLDQLCRSQERPILAILAAWTESRGLGPEAVGVALEADHITPGERPLVLAVPRAELLDRAARTALDRSLPEPAPQPGRVWVPVLLNTTELRALSWLGVPTEESAS
jgi:hypothetical protein